MNVSNDGAARPPAVDTEGVSLLDLVNSVLRRRIMVTACAGTLLVVVSTVTLLAPRRYTAWAAFIPETPRTPSNLSSLAAQLGLAVPGGDAGQSSSFYADFLKSREVLRSAAESQYVLPSDTGPVHGTFLNLYRIRRSTPRRQLERGTDVLTRMVSATVAQRTGVVRLRVTAQSPALAAQISQRLLDLMNTFNLERRQSRATAERRFTEQRLEEARRDLSDAEDRLKTFLQRNRDYHNSPELSMQQDRLARDIGMRQQLFTSLSQAFEQAKIEEVRDTPVITVIERPEVPVIPDSRRVLWKGALAVVVGGLLGALFALGSDFFRSAAALEPEGLRRFRALRRDTLDDFRHPLRAVRRALYPPPGA